LKPIHLWIRELLVFNITLAERPFEVLLICNYDRLISKRTAQEVVMRAKALAVSVRSNLADIDIRGSRVNRVRWQDEDTPKRVPDQVWQYMFFTLIVVLMSSQ
jgi:hypothetical protein